MGVDVHPGHKIDRGSEEQTAVPAFTPGACQVSGSVTGFNEVLNYMSCIEHQGNGYICKG